MWSKSNNPRLSYSWFGEILPSLHLAVILTFDTLTLNFCNTSGVMCSNYVQNLSKIAIRRRVTDHLAHFSHPVLGGGALSPDSSQGCVDQTSPNLARTHSDHGQVTSLFQSEISCCIFKCRCLKVEQRWKWRQISQNSVLQMTCYLHRTNNIVPFLNACTSVTQKSDLARV